MILIDRPESVHPPLSPTARWIEWLFWIFLFSFAFDYRAPQGSTSSSLAQFSFLGLSLGATAGIIFLGWQSLLVRPLAWIIGGWGLFLGFLLINSLVLQSVPASRFIRVVLPFGLCLAGMMNAHLAACAGLRLARLATPVYIAAVLNIVWRNLHGFLFAEITLETARIEILSPALTWIAAFIGCAIMLRSRFHWTLILAIALLFFSILLSVTRALIFPIMASALASCLAFVFAARWKTVHFGDLRKRFFPIGAALMLAAAGIGIASVAFPTILVRWQERLFTPTFDRNLTEDPSILSRKAEAEGIFEILNKDPISYLHGQGVGASYYWHPKYLNELSLIYPEGSLSDTRDVWFAGHSIWTYALFSGGILGLLSFIALFASAVVISLRAAAANIADPGPDHWLLYLPMITACCLLSQSITSNPFDERLLGLLFGTTIGLAQTGFVRGSWIGRE